MATAEDTTERRNGTPPAPNATATEYVPLPEAARRLGISAHAVRRQLRAGQLQGRRAETPQGYRWMILLAADALPGGGVPAATSPQEAGSGAAARDAAPHDAPPDRAAAPRNPSDGATRRAAQGDDAPFAAAGAELVASQRAREMAEYSAALLEPWRRQAAEQAERIGRLEERAEHLLAERDTARAELEQTRVQLAEAIAPPPEPEPECRTPRRLVA